MRHPKRFFTQESFIRSARPFGNLYFQKSCTARFLATCTGFKDLRRRSICGTSIQLPHILHLRPNLYPSAHFTKRFPGHAFCFVQHKLTETKMMNYSFAGTWGQADRLTARQGKRDEKRRNGKSEKKKDVGSSCLELRVPQQVAASQTLL